MDSFAPLPALAGGILIGIASAMLWVGNGRITGISGIFGQLLPPARTVLWRLLFLVSMIAGGFGAAAIWPQLGVGGDQPAQLVGTPLWIAAAGLIVGLGTKIGNGCTSGHGVCGLGRLSLRSLVAVAVFFGVAIITVTVTGVAR